MGDDAVELRFVVCKKKLISLRVGDPQLPTIINVFPNSRAGDFLKLPLYYKSLSEQSIKGYYEIYLIGMFESNESPAVPRYPSIVT